MSSTGLSISRDELTVEVCGATRAGFYNPFVPEVPLDTWGIHLKVETDKALIHFHLKIGEAKLLAKYLRKAVKDAKQKKREEDE